MKTIYFITMIEGAKQSYVATKNDVEVGGFVDAAPVDFGFPTREEAENAMAELQAYSAEKGYNLSFFIEEAETYGATIKTYPNNAILFVDGDAHDINWDGMEFENKREYYDWIAEVLMPADMCDNYDDVRMSLEIATDYLRPDTLIENVECTRDGHQGITLSYDLDGYHAEVTGEFYIDKDGMLHHTAIDCEGHEVEITYKYF